MIKGENLKLKENELKNIDLSSLRGTIEFTCQYCRKISTKGIFQYRKKKNHFCSLDCCNNYFRKYYRANRKKTKCIKCGKIITNYGNKYYCSYKCFDETRRNLNYANKRKFLGNKVIKCKHCNKVITIRSRKDYKNNKNFFCDRVCYLAFLKKRTKIKYTHKCSHCNKIFFKPYDTNAKFCSHSCHSKNKSHFYKVKCHYCNKIFIIQGSKRKNAITNFCSIDCRNKASIWYGLEEKYKNSIRSWAKSNLGNINKLTREIVLTLVELKKGEIK